VACEWQPCELLYTCYLLSYLLTAAAVSRLQCIGVAFCYGCSAVCLRVYLLSVSLDRTMTHTHTHTTVYRPLVRALTLLVGRQEGHPACKKTEWWGAGTRCRLAYGPADATTTHCLFASVKSRLVVPFLYRLTWVVLDKVPLNGCVCVWSGTTRVGWYQKKHSPTHTHPDHRTSFIIFLHLQRSMASSLFSLRA